MNLNNKNKGITLVALVITIIILLILAGITINSLTGNGLFEKARIAKREYDNTGLEENEILQSYQNELEKVTGSVRDFATGTELYKLENPTWEAVPVAKMNEDITKYKILRIDFVSCWGENTVPCSFIGSVWVEPTDLNIGISCSLNYYDWYCNNIFKFENNSFIINYNVNLIYSGSRTSFQTANIYRVIGYN